MTRTQKGFSLIEVLVVVSIGLILAGVASVRMIHSYRRQSSAQFIMGVSSKITETRSLLGQYEGVRFYIEKSAVPPYLNFRIDYIDSGGGAIANDYGYPFQNTKFLKDGNVEVRHIYTDGTLSAPLVGNALYWLVLDMSQYPGTNIWGYTPSNPEHVITLPELGGPAYAPISNDYKAIRFVFTDSKGNVFTLDIDCRTGAISTNV